MKLGDYGTMTIEEIKRNQNLSVLSSSVGVETSVRLFKAVVNVNGDLIHIGDYIKYCVPSPSYTEVIGR